MIESIFDMWDDGPIGKICLILLILLVASIPVVIYKSIQDQQNWDEFKKTHDCKKVGEISSTNSVGVGFGLGANGTIGTILTNNSIPGKIGYFCNDGVTYWR